MACKLDIKAAITDKVSSLSKTHTPEKINSMFGIEVIKPSGRIFIPSTLVDEYFEKYKQSKQESQANQPFFSVKASKPTDSITANKENYLKRLRLEINSLNQEMSRLLDKLRSIPISNVQKRAKLYKDVENISNRIDDLKVIHEDLKDDFIIDETTPQEYQQQLEAVFANDFQRVDKLLNVEGLDLDSKIRNLQETQRIVKFYTESGNFSTKTNYLFSDTTQVSEEEKMIWQSFRDKAETYQGKITDLHRQIVLDTLKSLPTVKEYMKMNNIEDFDYDFLVSPARDKDLLSMNVLTLGDSYFTEQILVVDVLRYLINKYDNAGIKQRRDVVTKIDDLLIKIKDKHNNYDVFKQIDENGFTGRIIFPYSQSYFDERRNVNKKYNDLIRRLRHKISGNTESDTSDADSSGDNISKIKKILNDAITNWKRWRLGNEIVIDYAKIPEIAEEFSQFSDEFDSNITDRERQVYKEFLIKHLGSKSYESTLNRIREKLKEYGTMLEYYQEMGNNDVNELLNNIGLRENVKLKYQKKNIKLTSEDLILVWKALNSPFYNVNELTNYVSQKIILPSDQSVSYIIDQLSEVKGKFYSYLEIVPRKYKADVKINKEKNKFEVTETNESTNYYDGNFSKIENDADLYAFWEFAIKNLALAKKMIPYKYQSQYNVNSILYMEKTFIEAFADKGKLGAVFSGAYDTVVNSLTDGQLSTTVFEENPFSPTARNINYTFLGQRKDLENKLYTKLLLQYFISKGYEFTPETYDKVKDSLDEKDIAEISSKMIQLRKQAQKEIAEKASFDLGSILKFQLGTIVALNQRDNILPLLTLLEKTVSEIKQANVNRAGDMMIDAEKNISVNELKLVNQITQLNYALDVFTGQPTQDVEGVSSRKMLTTDEKVETENLDKLKEKASLEQQQFIEALQNSLGKEVTASGTLDSAMAYLRFRYLGWAIDSQIPNAAAGYFANFAVAADGRIIKMSALRRAYNIFLHTVMPSFLRSSVKSEQLDKIKNLMYRGDFLSDATSEIQKSRFSYNEGKNKDKWFSPYTPTRTTEYMNQGVLVVARLMSVTVEDNNGKKSNLFDALDKDLKIKPEFSNIAEKWNWETGVSMESEMIKIRELISDTHGAYSEINKLYAKKKVAGRMALFFKTWLPNAIKARFGAERSSLYYGMKTKGRYRSYTPATAALAGAALGTWIVPGIGSLVGYGIGFGVAKVFGNDINKNIQSDFKDSFQALGYLLQRMFYTKMSLINPAYADKLESQFEGKFDELDAANLRANLQEIQNMLTLILVYFVAKATLYDDDEDKKNQLVHNFTINQIVKMQNDLMFYTSPQTPGKLVEQLFPLTGLIDESFTLMVSAHKTIFQYELEPNEDGFGENVLELFPNPLPSGKSLERVYAEPKIFRNMFEEE